MGVNPGPTMKAIVQEGYGSPDVLRLREIDVPALDDDRVLVKVRAASVNAADCHLLRGEFPLRLMTGLRRPKTAVPGSDLAGVVVAIGANVSQFKPGDEVFGTAVAAFAEYASAREDRLVSKPGRLTFEEAAAVPVAGVTALQGLRDRGQVQPGQHVLIHGAGGGVGTFAVQIALALGARVTAVTGPRNVELVRSLGPDEVIDYTQQDVTRLGVRYDVFFDVAATRPLLDCRRALKRDGTFVAAGAAKGNGIAIVARLAMELALSRVGRQRFVPFLARITHDDLVALAELVEAGKLRPAVDRTYSLADAPEAIGYVTSGEARAKVAITVA